MKKWFFNVVVCSVNVFILAAIMPGVEVKNIFSAIVVAIVLSLLDAIIKPLLILVTLPATILTLGLFLFVINAMIILIDDHFVHGFEVAGFWYALFFSIVLSFFNSFVHKKAYPEDRNEPR